MKVKFALEQPSSTCVGHELARSCSQGKSLPYGEDVLTVLGLEECTYSMEHPV